MRSALITGVTGQDGSYLAEFLISKGYCVIGATRDKKNINESFPGSLRDSIKMVNLDLVDQDCIVNVLMEHQPDEIYNFAAYSSGSGMYDNPIQTAEVNGLGVARLLEGIRLVNCNMRFCQASSREIFGDATESPQTESTPTRPRSPYGAAKLYADSMVRIYRHYYNIFSCSAILFNHESPRRGLGFVTRKVVREAVKIKLGLANELRLGNLDAKRDWGFAGDYVQAMWLMLQKDHPDDYVVATGLAHSVRDLCSYVFNYLGLDYLDYVREDETSFRPVESNLLIGCSGKAKVELGWVPEVSFTDLLRLMVDSEIADLSRI